MTNTRKPTKPQSPAAPKKTNTVTVRWFDGYKEDFECSEVRFSGDLLWLRLTDGSNRHIPLSQVRWFAMSIESHQNTRM